MLVLAFNAVAQAGKDWAVFWQTSGKLPSNYTYRLHPAIQSIENASQNFKSLADFHDQARHLVALTDNFRGALRGATADFCRRN